MTWVPTLSQPSKGYDRLYASLTAMLPGAGKQQLEVEMANAFQAFCRETGAWRERISRNTIANLATYELQPEANRAQVVWVITVKADGRYYSPLGGDSIASDNGRYFSVCPDYTTITLNPVPAATKPKALQCVVSLAPIDGSLDLPGDVIDQYFEVIRSGVLERMYAHKARPYSDPAEAEKNARKFHAAITRVRRDVRGGNAQASPPWRFPGVATGGSRRGGGYYDY